MHGWEPINIHDLSSIDHTSSIKVIESLSDSVTRLEKVIHESQKEEEVAPPTTTDSIAGDLAKNETPNLKS